MDFSRRYQSGYRQRPTSTSQAQPFLTPFILPFPPQNQFLHPQLPSPILPFIVTTHPSQSAIDPSIQYNIGGFLADYQSLQNEVLALKKSECKWNSSLVSLGEKFSQVSEDWCSSHAQLASNQALVSSQDAEISKLRQEIDAIKRRNSSTREIFLKTTKSLENASLLGSQLEKNEQIPSMSLVPARPRGVQRFNSLPEVTVTLSRLSQSYIARATARINAQAQLKRDLARKTRLLSEVARLIHRSRNILQGKPLGRPRKVRDNTPLTGSHSRDFSISWRKGYKCICGEKFAIITDLHRHLARVTGNKNFSCDDCEEKFLFFMDMKRHMMGSHGKRLPENLVGCRYCGKLFPSRSDWLGGWKHRKGSCIRE